MKSLNYHSHPVSQYLTKFYTTNLLASSTDRFILLYSYPMKCLTNFPSNSNPMV